MIRRLFIPLFTLLLVLPSAARAEPAPQPAPDVRAEALVLELLNNVDWELMLRLQENLMRNLDLIGPYSEEYIACLQAEGSLEKEGPLDLRTLLEQAQNAGSECRVILQALGEQLDFDLTREELEKGLSPEYQELLEKSL
ncbi:hypothetical protein [Motiliproteus sp. SC1-56]|uniref:hypothetical protein n=1 Tax=Motiliproteus sp. SC1-56 TaxID=2799565 RepID=UPI001A8CCA6A|nr:hypothetical protein [Motiliproteus sp. SC1-56]